MRRALTIALWCVLFLFSASLRAQVYVDGGNTRHRFAQLNLGVENRYFPSRGTRHFTGEDGSGFRPEKIPEQLQPALVIGGTHFWGHADFYISIPVFSVRTEYRPFTETGMKWYPLRLKQGKIRLFAGVSWLPSGYRYGKGVRHVRHEFPLLAGLTYRSKHFLFEAGAAYHGQTERSYYVTRNNQVEVNTSALRFTAGVKWVFDSTLGAEKNWQSGKTKSVTDTLASRGKLDGFTISLGASSAVFFEGSDHNKEQFAYLDKHKLSGLFPEVGIGYYFHRPDVQINLAYRRIKSTLEAFGHKQTALCNSLVLEGFKFLGDYHGFVPFAGIGLNAERLQLRDMDNAYPARLYQRDMMSPGLTFGWDIRPNRIQRLYLRTTLRWFPFSELTTDGSKTFSFHRLEVNFIQAVWYPGR